MSRTSKTSRFHCWVYLALMLLFGLTYWAAHIDLGSANTVLGLAIASIKAALVMIFFMNLKSEGGTTRSVAVAGLLWLLLLIGLCLADYSSRSWLPAPGSWPQPLSHDPAQDQRERAYG